MQVARNTRPECHFKLWATNQLVFVFQWQLPSTHGTEKGLTPFTVHMDVELGIVHKENNLYYDLSKHWKLYFKTFLYFMTRVLSKDVNNLYLDKG